MLAIGLVFITLPSFFERLHSDEVIYWEVASNIASGMGAVSETTNNRLFFWHMPLPFFATAPFLKFVPHIFTARVISSLFTIGTFILVFLIGERKFGRDEGLIGAFLFLFSFQALRFGGRYYLDQYGAFFFLLSLYLVMDKRYSFAGISALAAILAREYWLGVYPFLLLYIQGRRERLLFVTPAVAGFLGFMVYLIYTSNLQVLRLYIFESALKKNFHASVFGHGFGGYLRQLLRGWAEFSILNILVIVGFIRTLGQNRRIIFLVLPQFIVISLIHGFIVDGGVTQYTLPLIATLAIFSGQGLKLIYEQTIGAFIRRRQFTTVAFAVVFMQFIALNAMATGISLHKNIGIYAFGYSDDKEIIRILKTEAKGQFIHGIHGAFIQERGRWDWTDYMIQEAIEKDPDWLITYDNYVEISSEEILRKGLKIYRIGPYVMIHPLKKGLLGLAVRQKEFPKWALLPIQNPGQP